MSCTNCERRARYMAADPEMYRGEDTRCSAHRQLAAAKSKLTQVERELEKARRELEKRNEDGQNR